MKVLKDTYFVACVAGIRKGRVRELRARDRARERRGTFPFSLARSRAPKFPLLLPLLTPATQATYFEYRSPHVRNSGFRNLETFTGGIRNPKNFCCGTRTPQSRGLESVIQRKESGIQVPLTRNPVVTLWSGITLLIYRFSRG